MSNIIIPSTIDEASVRVPMQFPLRPDADTVIDANGRCVLTIDSSIEKGETFKFAKLFAKAPEMWELLGDCYAMLAILAKVNGIQHGQEDEPDKDKCLLCRCEELLDGVK
jgi:hypothetical protein